jgi:hypothetical protein
MFFFNTNQFVLNIPDRNKISMQAIDNKRKNVKLWFFKQKYTKLNIPAFLLAQYNIINIS